MLLSISMYENETWTLHHIEIKVLRNHLRWLGHVSRMEDERPVQALVFVE